MELTRATLKHFVDLRWHRSTLLEGVSVLGIRHMSHLLGAASRLGVKRIGDERTAERVFDLIHQEQGMSADRNSRRMVKFISIIAWEMYLCLLYVELEGYRSASRRERDLVFPPLEHLLEQKAKVVEELKTLRDKVLHPAKSINLGDAQRRFMDSGALVDGHYYKTVLDLQRGLDMYLFWLGGSLLQVGTDELNQAAQCGRRIEKGRLEVLRRARVALAKAPPLFRGGVFDQNARQTPFDMQKWWILGLYREIRLEHDEGGRRPDFLRLAKTDGMRMLMRSLVFANEYVHLINFEKLRSIKTRAELDERQPLELLSDGTSAAATGQEIENLMAPWRVSCALLAEPLRLYYETVEAMPTLRRESIEEALGAGPVPKELARFRNLVFHVGGDRDANDIELEFLNKIQGVDDKSLPLDLLPMLLDFFMTV